MVIFIGIKLGISLDKHLCERFSYGPHQSSLNLSPLFLWTTTLIYPGIGPNLVLTLYQLTMFICVSFTIYHQNIQHTVDWVVA